MLLIGHPLLGTVLETTRTCGRVLFIEEPLQLEKLILVDHWLLLDGRLVKVEDAGTRRRVVVVIGLRIYPWRAHTEGPLMLRIVVIR